MEKNERSAESWQEAQDYYNTQASTFEAENAQKIEKARRAKENYQDLILLLLTLSLLFIFILSTGA
jgi:hypothetical protein